MIADLDSTCLVQEGKNSQIEMMGIPWYAEEGLHTMTEIPVLWMWSAETQTTIDTFCSNGT